MIPPPRQGGGGTIAPAVTHVATLSDAVVHVVEPGRVGFVVLCCLVSAFFVLILIVSLILHFSVFSEIFIDFEYFLFVFLLIFHFFNLGGRRGGGREEEREGVTTSPNPTPSLQTSVGGLSAVIVLFTAASVTVS